MEGKKTATTHSSREKGYSDHNDKNCGKRKNADSTRTPYNVQWCLYLDMKFPEAELRFYDENLQGQINATNFKAIKYRHKERMTSAEKLLEQISTKPEEVVLQVGNKDNHVPSKKLLAVHRDYIIWHDQKFGDHVVILNWALHIDEMTPHIQQRQTWVYQHPDGYMAIGQHKALEQMGYTLPNPDKPRGKHNNLKMVYTAECRAKWIEICREHGIEIETEPLHRAPNEQNLDKGDYIIIQQDKKISELQRQLEDRERAKKAIDESIVIKSSTLDIITAQIASQREESLRVQEILTKLSLSIENGEFDVDGERLYIKNILYCIKNTPGGHGAEYLKFLKELNDYGEKFLNRDTRLPDLNDSTENGERLSDPNDSTEDEEWDDKR